MNTDTGGDERRHPSGRYAVVAVAASAGGIRALSVVLGGLPEDFPVPVVVVQHLDPRHETVLAELLAYRTSLEVRLAEAGEALRPGTVRIAPPDRHVVFDAQGRLELSDSVPLNFSRPSADRLFASAAEVFGAGVLACVLTGAGSDGAAGVRAVREAGGTVLVEDPATAEFGSMPGAAVATGAVDEVVALGDLAARLLDLVEEKRR